MVIRTSENALDILSLVRPLVLNVSQDTQYYVFNSSFTSNQRLILQLNEVPSGKCPVAQFQEIPRCSHAKVDGNYPAPILSLSFSQPNGSSQFSFQISGQLVSIVCHDP